MNDDFELQELAQVTWSHLAGLGGYLKDLEESGWVREMSDPRRRADTRGILAGLGEHARITRLALSTLLSAGATEANLLQPSPKLQQTLESQSHHRLPFNRTERYFTGTVLPFIIASDGLAHLERFVKLCGVPGSAFHDLTGGSAFQLFTAYSFAEAVLAGRDDARFPKPRPVGETPDILIAGSGWLLAVHATMFRRPARSTLQGQLTKQRALLDYIARCLETPAASVYHVALLPQALRRRLESGGAQMPNVRTITWEEVAGEFHFVAPPYWMAQLDYANAHGDELAATNHGGTYADATLPGWVISDGYTNGNPQVTQYTYMGRVRGLHGPEMTADIAEETWPMRRFQVRRTERLHANWFPIADFLRILPSGHS